MGIENIHVMRDSLTKLLDGALNIRLSINQSICLWFLKNSFPERKMSACTTFVARSWLVLR
jgi:hypothetical protein